ncbi:response regulator [Nocardia fluminea]|uniref:response regulator n=1 Tax=Nocardia fluminea TaxID=134984 RepID=UPI00364D838A
MATVLLLEDNDRFARAVKRVLRGHDVKHVKTVHSAIGELANGGVDCALIDLNLTDDDDYSGYEVLSYILRYRPDLPRAVVTGSRLKGAIRRNILLRYGVGDIVIKGDVDREGYGTIDLVDTVSDLLEGSQSRRRGVAQDEIAAISQGVQKEFRRRIDVLQQLADRLGRGTPRHDATANSRKSLSERAARLVELESAAKVRCEDLAVDHLADEVARFEIESERLLNDS